VARVIVLDSGVLIAYLNPADAHHERVVSFLVERADEPFSVATLTLSECLVHPARSDKLPIALESLRMLELDVEDMRERDAIPMARLREETRLKMPDAVVLHTAMAFAGSVATTDRALSIAAMRVGVAAQLLV
jgi:predicted nucleic acid-binding protein